MKFTLFDLTIDYFKKYKIENISMLIFSLIFYFRNVIFPKILNKLIRLENPNTNSIYKTLFISFILIFFNYIYALLCSWNGKIVTDFFLDKFYISLIDNREKNLNKATNSVLYNNISLFVNEYEYLLNRFYSCLPFIVTILGITSYLFSIDKKLSILYLSSSIGFILILTIFSKNLVQYSEEFTIKRNDLLNIVEDIDLNLINVTSFDNVNNEKKKIKLYLRKFIKEIIKMRVYSFSLGLIFNILYFILSGFIIYSVKNKVLAGHLNMIYLNELIIILLTFSVITIVLDIGKVIEFCIYKGSIHKYLDEINKYFPEINRKLILDKQNKNIDSNILNIIKLNFSYNNKSIFNNLNIEFKENHVNCIIGEIGTGKSTLLKLIYGFMNFDSGNISCNGKLINGLELSEWRKNFHYLSQTPILFDRDIDENINYCSNSKENKKIIEELEISNIYDEITKNKNSSKLSGGQKQIVSLLRILFQPKKIVLLDEPTSALDPKTKKIVYKIIKYMKNKKITLIIVTHDKELEEIADNKISL